MDKEDKVQTPVAVDEIAAVDGGRRARRTNSRETNRRGSEDPNRQREQSEWEEKIIQVRRVTKVVKGGKKLSFRAVVAVGNGKGQAHLPLLPGLFRHQSQRCSTFYPAHHLV